MTSLQELVDETIEQLEMVVLRDCYRLGRNHGYDPPFDLCEQESWTRYEDVKFEINDRRT